MNPNVTYASRKRRKPVQKIVKPSPVEGVKSNPSKRHRDRLNAELDRLASLLPFPQDVIAKLDKLSVLRLSVSYLRAKSFFDVALKSSNSARPERNGIQESCRTNKPGEGIHILEGELLLQALNGFVLVVTSDALVFYVSSTIQDYLGFQQSDIIHQSVFELIHTEDRPEFQRQLHWALNPAQSTDSAQRVQDNGFSQPAAYYNPEQLPPENSSFMERNFICRLRCLLDNSSGFLAMNFQGRLKFLHGQNKKGKDGSTLSPQLALFAVATPLQPPSILEIRTKNFIFRTKHKLDFTPTGCDAKGKIVLGYTEAELCMRGTGYQFVHAADMLYCAENHVRMIKTGESGMTVFRLLTKENRWAWVQANARLVYKNGRPDYIIATQRPLTDEEGAEHLRKRNMKLPFMFATGEAVLYEVTFPVPSLMDPSQAKMKSIIGKGAAAKATLHKESVDPSSLLGAMLRQDESVYLCPPASNKLSFERSFFTDARDELGNVISSSWQDNLLPVGNNILKQELTECPQESNFILPENNAELFQDNKNSDLYSIMKSLGIDFEDIKCIQQDEEFLKTEFSGVDDIGDMDITDEILTYVQDSLNNKTDFLYSGCHQQQPMVQNASCLVQQEFDQQQLHQHQKQVVEQHQQQLCQKMKHMQVNGMFSNWNSVSSVPLSCSQQPEQYAFPGTHGTTQECTYKSEVNVAPYACRQEFIPYKQPTGMVPQLSNFTQIDFPVGSFDGSTYPASSTLEGFLNCLQHIPENQGCGINSEPVMLTPQTCYAGAVSMYQCPPETQPNCMDQMQYNPMMASQQALLHKFQNGFNGGNLNEAYPPQLNVISNTQTTAHLQPLHHPTEPRPFSDLASSGFM
ncbi:aryl hydrocarbon receptor isoform X2 [Alligator mississippiensis]|uniref:aryl hydrocarbon receptor isoform X2 n=1 Tax=Alligator mississippiensis TaxID=8496 RepID=UPI0028776230|nr:aryl hydrocarbon receptor isoform X2 [Alligator mississippiensis]